MFLYSCFFILYSLFFILYSLFFILYSCLFIRVSCFLILSPVSTQFHEIHRKTKHIDIGRIVITQVRIIETER
ncbi:hypothetical protein DTW91_11150 [Chryseobacterium sp. SC28]|nr:hypothetical protein DTW91_11150 [Chryseobacterium sp. SC28]